MNKTVSVIIPCYNGEQFIDRCINSVVSQDYPSIEIIIVNDGSTDKSEEKILAWKNVLKNTGRRLIYVKQENKGLGGAINSGLKYVSGEYLTLLDADDCFLQGSISKRVNFLVDHVDCVGVKSNGWMINGEQKSLFVKDEDEKNISDLFMALVCGKTNNWAGTYMVRTKDLFAFYPNREIYPSRYGQNLQIIMPVAYKRKFGYIDEPLMEYIIQPESLSKSIIRDFEKEEQNAVGYQDIYTHMIDLIVKDQAEHDKYMKITYSCYYRNALLRAISFNKYDRINELYKNLASTGLLTLDDRIIFYSIKCRPISFVLRCVRKVVNMIFRGRKNERDFL